MSIQDQPFVVLWVEKESLAWVLHHSVCFDAGFDLDGQLDSDHDPELFENKILKNKTQLIF